MKELKAMKAVYCYYFPEIRPLLHEVESKIPDDMYLVTTPAKKVQKDLESLFDPALEIPSNPDGSVSLDEIHNPIIERILKAYNSTVPKLGSFECRYPTQGSSEGLFHILTQFKVKGVEEINVLNGEYEGYATQANNLGMKVNTHEFGKVKGGQPGVWFISNPSACDGNIIPNESITWLCDKGNKVVLDLAYVGATKPYVFDISHENISSMVMSFSKPYGVFRFRVGGVAFSREEVPSLYGNKWFKDILRLFQALKIAEEIGPYKLYEKYKPIQEEIITDINKEHGLNIHSSDSFLLGHIRKFETEKLSQEQLELIAPFERGNNYRFCLTPYFEEKEKQNK